MPSLALQKTTRLHIDMDVTLVAPAPLYRNEHTNPEKDMQQEVKIYHDLTTAP